jgi:hypothetical protein
MLYVNAVHRAVVVRIALGILLTSCAEGSSPGGGDVDGGGSGADAPPGAPDAPPVPPGAPDAALAVDGGPSPSDARGADAFTGPATFAFQDGAAPTAAYAGTRDTHLRESEASTPFGARTGAEIDADSPDFSGLRVHTLLRWDLTAIPSGARVTGVRLALEVLDWPGNIAVCEVRPLRRDWDEVTATWQNATQGQAWDEGGAIGSLDHSFNTVVGGLSPRANGPYTIALNAPGVTEVQRWVDDPSTNFGFVIYDVSADGMEIATRESGAVASRPRLIVDVE